MTPSHTHAPRFTLDVPFLPPFLYFYTKVYVTGILLLISARIQPDLTARPQRTGRKVRGVPSTALLAPFSSFSHLSWQRRSLEHPSPRAQGRSTKLSPQRFANKLGEHTRYDVIQRTHSFPWTAAVSRSEHADTSSPRKSTV